MSNMDEEWEEQMTKIWSSAINAVTSDLTGCARAKLVFSTEEIHSVAFPTWKQEVIKILRLRGDYQFLVQYWGMLLSSDKIRALRDTEISYKNFVNAIAHKCLEELELQVRREAGTNIFIDRAAC